MKTIVLDFETFYSNEFSLRKMTPVEYILDPRFEVIGCAVKDDDFAVWMTPEELRDYLAGLPAKTAVISHNALFDMCILAWIFDYVPHLMIDTLGMARAWLGHRLKSLALASVSAHYGVGIKGDTVHKVIGMNAAAIRQAGFYDEYARYSCNDADLCYTIFRKMMLEGFPANELAVLDTVLRCAVEPKFVLDQTLLAEHLNDIQVMKQNLLAQCGLANRDDLMSNDKFALALESLGVVPPTKISLTTGKETFAFAKTDSEFLDLEEHEDPRVGALVSARLGVKSTIEETRTQRLMSIANLTWPGNKSPGLMPMPLRYGGAHTHRLSGDWKLNMQNLPSRGNNKIRSAIIAPHGHTVLTCDASQIEARLNAWFSGDTDLVASFAAGNDVYSEFATDVYGYPVSKALKKERTLGKIAILGLGYNMGVPKFAHTVKIQSGGEIIVDEIEAARVVQTYRTKYRAIKEMWATLHDMLPQMTGDISHTIGPVTFERGRIRLPTGLYLNYHNLRFEGNQWRYDYAGRPKTIYGGKLLENIIQALARICVMDAAVRVRKRIGQEFESRIHLNLQVHDELVYVVPNHLVEALEEIVLQEMRARPIWGFDIPLDAESGTGASFGDAK